MILLAWPDPAYLEGVVFGFPLLGVLERPAFFRSALPNDPVLSREHLLATSIEWIDSLEATMGPSGDPAKNAAMQEQTEKDVGTFSSAPRTRAEMDERWGRGQWRPYRRFVIFQPHNGKWRAIDDGSAALHNEAISAAFTEAYRQKFDTRFMTDVTSARTEGDDIVLELSPDGEELRVDAVLVATGRLPNGDQLRLAEHGYAMDDAGYVVTDTHLRTTVDGVFALGDVTNPVQLKHVANHEARVVAHNLSNPDSMIEVNHELIPHAVFGHPQVASVGMTERQAAEAGINYTAHVQHYGSAAYGWAMEDTTSIVKLVMDTRTRTLLGAHICGPQASTLIQQLIQGMVFGRTVDEMSRGQYYIHPALPEVIEQALLEL